MKYLNETDVKGKKVLVRVDYNVPFEGGSVSDYYRIAQTRETLEYLHENGARVSLLFHLGRPGGKVDEDLRTERLAELVDNYWPGSVRALKEVQGLAVNTAIENQDPDELIMLENVRFWPGEEANDAGFAEMIAKPFDMYVQEAFGNSHREHASMVSIPRYLETVYGFLFQSEVEAMDLVLNEAERPFVLIIGGDKVETKIGLIRKGLEMADKVLLGSALARPFVDFAAGREVEAGLSQEILALGQHENYGNLVMPIDGVFAESMESAEADSMTLEGGLGEGLNAFDIGDETIEEYLEVIEGAKTIVWNGPLGVFENKLFGHGSKEVAKAITRVDAYQVVGGGETMDLFRNLGLLDQVNHVSTGGGAMLYYLQNRTFPLLEVKKD